MELIFKICTAVAAVAVTGFVVTILLGISWMAIKDLFLNKNPW